MEKIYEKLKQIVESQAQVQKYFNFLHIFIPGLLTADAIAMPRVGKDSEQP